MALYNNKDHWVYTLNIVYNYKTYLILVVIFFLSIGQSKHSSETCQEILFFFLISKINGLIYR